MAHGVRKCRENLPMASRVSSPFYLRDAFSSSDRIQWNPCFFSHSTFLKSLQECLENPTKLGPLIENFENNFHVMYVKYCQNKPVSEHILAEHLDYFKEIQKKLDHRLGVSAFTRTANQTVFHRHLIYRFCFPFHVAQLCDLLIKPIQRIMKYELLLKAIYEHTERAGLKDELPNLMLAIGVMRVSNTLWPFAVLCDG